MNINSYLNNILTKQNAEDVVEAFIGAVDALNTDGLVDITPEKAIVSTAVIGKTIRRCIARILRLLSQYTPNKKILIVTQDEYDNLVDVNENVLYVIRKDSRCFTATIDSDGYFDMLKHGAYLPGEAWWTPFSASGLVRDVVDLNNGVGNIELFVGKDFNVSEVYADMFSGSKGDHLEKIRIDLTSYVISARAFKECKDLRIARLGSGITSISEDAFDGCTDLTIIIDKAEDSVLGAPWGAQNATVIWDE